MKKLFLLVFSAVLLLSCSSDDGSVTQEEVTLFVNHFKTTSFTSLDTVFLIQEDEAIGSDYYRDAFTISGFDFEPGFTYKINVTKTTRQNPGVDFENVTYQFLSLIDKETVPGNETFTVPLGRIFNVSGYVTWLVGNSTFGFSILNQIEIDCSALCSDLEAVLINFQEANGVFQHGDNGEYVLVDLY